MDPYLIGSGTTDSSTANIGTGKFVGSTEYIPMVAASGIVADSEMASAKPQNQLRCDGETSGTLVCGWK